MDDSPSPAGHISPVCHHLSATIYPAPAVAPTVNSCTSATSQAVAKPTLVPSAPKELSLAPPQLFYAPHHCLTTWHTLLWTKASPGQTVCRFSGTSTFPRSSLCISQFQDWCCYHGSQGWSSAVTYPDTGKVVEQLLYPLHWNFTFCSSEGSYSGQRIWNPIQGRCTSSLP